MRKHFGNPPHRSVLTRRVSVWAILSLAFILRSYHLGYPAWDYHNWRQTTTLMVARDFARNGFHLLHPQVAWMGDKPGAPSYFSGEFSIQGVFTAVLYKVFGEADVIPRMVTIGFSLLGIIFLYDLLKRRAGVLAGCLGAFIYSMLPYHLFFGRVFMPDVPAVALALGGLTWLDRWTDDRKRATLIAAATLSSLAVLQKLTVVFIGLPVLYLFWCACRKRLWTHAEPYFFAAVVGVPALAWYSHSARLAKESGFAIMQPIIFAKHLGMWGQEQFRNDMFKALWFDAFSPLGIGLVVLGLFWAGSGRAAWVFRLCFLGAATLLFLTPEALRENQYYLTLLLPGGALAGLALANFSSDRRVYPLLALVLVFFAAGAIQAALPFYQPDRWPYDLGRLLNRVTEPGDLIAAESGGSPNVLYFADRRGWLRGRDYGLPSIERQVQQGARYYADVFAGDQNQQRLFFHALDSRYERLTQDGQSWPWPIYRLAPLPGAVSGGMGSGTGLNFDNRVELLKYSTRELLKWPPSFELIYEWRCLTPIDTDLRVLVHFVDASGRVVYQQDHWPLGGQVHTSKWKTDDAVHERYIVVLPESLPSGHYQILVGWFDPVTGRRLPLVNAGTLARDDRALVAELTVGLPPKYGWLTPD